MTTFRVSYSGDQWVVKKSGRIIKRADNKRVAKQMMDRRAQPGDTKIIERKDGSVMSEKTEPKVDQVNPMQTQSEDSGGLFDSLF
jgi:hypothetical protein